MTLLIYGKTYFSKERSFTSQVTVLCYELLYSIMKWWFSCLEYGNFNATFWRKCSLLKTYGNIYRLFRAKIRMKKSINVTLNIRILKKRFYVKSNNNVQCFNATLTSYTTFDYIFKIKRFDAISFNWRRCKSINVKFNLKKLSKRSF